MSIGRAAPLVGDVLIHDPHPEPILRLAATAPSAYDDAPAAIESGASSAGGAVFGRLARFDKNYRRGLRLCGTPLAHCTALELIAYPDRGA